MIENYLYVVKNKDYQEKAREEYLKNQIQEDIAYEQQMSLKGSHNLYSF